MQAKDIPEDKILAFLAVNEGKWCFLVDATWPRDLFCVMPEGVNRKLALAKMRAMIKKGFVTGCGCGCRGDFEITPKGKAELLRLTGAAQDI